MGFSTHPHDASVFVSCNSAATLLSKSTLRWVLQRDTVRLDEGPGKKIHPFPCSSPRPPPVADPSRGSLSFPDYPVSRPGPSHWPLPARPRLAIALPGLSAVPRPEQESSPCP